MSNVNFLWQFLEDYTGIHCNTVRKKHLSHVVHERMRVHHCSNEPSYLNFIKSQKGKNELHLLIEEVTTGEASFIPTPEFEESIKSNIIPKLIANAEDENRPLRIWAAGCSTGEELYVLAIHLYEKYNALSIPITIIGTDSNSSALEKAKAGYYSKESFRGKEALEILSHFTIPDETTYRVKKYIRDMVEFKEIDLTTDFSKDKQFQNFDLIFCHDLLIHYDKRSIELLSQTLFLLLIEGGYLTLGETEDAFLSDQLPAPLSIDGYSWFKKNKQ